MKIFLKRLCLFLAFMILFSFNNASKAASTDVLPSDIVPYIKSYVKGLDEYQKDNISSLNFIQICWKKGYELYSKETGINVKLPYELTEITLTKCCATRNYNLYKLPNDGTRTKYNIPIGASVYFKDVSDSIVYCGSDNKGLVAIYLGNNQLAYLLNNHKIEISSINKIESYYEYQYVDWYFHNGLKVNSLKSIPENSTLSINLTSYPTKLSIGSSYSLKGSVSSNFSITKVYGGIYQNGVAIDYFTEYPNANNFDIYSSKLNKNLTFGSLPAGNYKLFIKAYDTTGKEISISKDFNVYRIASTLTINLTSYPEKHIKGKGFGLYGTITSNYRLSAVRGYIFDSKGNTVLTSLDLPNSKTLNINSANLNSSLKFGRLDYGTYTLEIRAIDGYGKVVKVSRKFTVTSSNVIGTVDIPSTWDNLSIRNGPGTNYTILGSMKDGAKCTVDLTKTKNSWYYVYYKGSHGYVAKNRINL